MKMTFRLKGGEGSGNFDHAGRPGEVGGSQEGKGAASSNAQSSWDKHATKDYQKRGNNYPDSDMPDDVTVFNGGARFAFKSTTERTAKRWVENYLKDNKLPMDSIEVGQAPESDYQDDWVNVLVRFPKSN